MSLTLSYSHILNQKKEVYKLKKGKITLIGTIVILFVAALLFINNSLLKRDISEVPPSVSPEIQKENEKRLKEVEEIQALLFQENGFFEQVKNKLEEKDYAHRMMLMIYSKDDIRVKYVLDNKGATESAQEEVKSLFYSVVKKNNLNPNSFSIKVGDNDDGPDW
ncbi:hypothetical protein [Pseudobacillus wudalianchiensis]|uniref:Uncharacterized protein n=1 Tax=Pseudobacillus wudalianchiensis TaxID=1743143 RepID=A0A1B9AZD3_9BACI|nr:hypothetical protein [Bacillus wudalianchiensis]OCA89317.1 hypothetical protein A8F95_21375 [Bacillus wudalianchiensis]